jgi:hypothetical protein
VTASKVAWTSSDFLESDRSLCREIVDMKSDPHKELDFTIHGTNVEIETVRTLAETM